MSRSLSLFCYMDTKTENSYHSFFLGVFGVALHDGMNVFVKSNAESGNGRFNIFIEFRDIKRVIIFELKQSKQPQALEKDAKDALFQILDRNYAYGFDDTHRLLIGASFHKRTMSSLYLTQFQRGLSCCKPAQTGTTMPSCQWEECPDNHPWGGGTYPNHPTAGGTYPANGRVVEASGRSLSVLLTIYSDSSCSTQKATYYQTMANINIYSISRAPERSRSQVTSDSNDAAAIWFWVLCQSGWGQEAGDSEKMTLLSSYLLRLALSVTVLSLFSSFTLLSGCEFVATTRSLPFTRWLWECSIQTKVQCESH